MLTREMMLRKLHARDEYYRRRARRSFAEFLRYTKPDYQLSWFHEELAGELDAFLDDVLAKRSPRLIINVPPQEGKSEQCWALWIPKWKSSSMLVSNDIAARLPYHEESRSKRTLPSALGLQIP